MQQRTSLVNYSTSDDAFGPFNKHANYAPICAAISDQSLCVTDDNCPANARSVLLIEVRTVGNLVCSIQFS